MYNVYVVERSTRKVVKRYMDIDHETAKHLTWFWDSETFFCAVEEVR